jgi:hypothetical protein
VPPTIREWTREVQTQVRPGAGWGGGRPVSSSSCCRRARARRSGGGRAAAFAGRCSRHAPILYPLCSCQPSWTGPRRASATRRSWCSSGGGPRGGGQGAWGRCRGPRVLGWRQAALGSHSRAAPGQQPRPEGQRGGGRSLRAQAPRTQGPSSHRLLAPPRRREVRHAYGRTALLLSGGGSLGSFHIVSLALKRGQGGRQNSSRRPKPLQSAAVGVGQELQASPPSPTLAPTPARPPLPTGCRQGAV